MTTTQTTASRNQREGRYMGKINGRHARVYELLRALWRKDRVFSASFGGLCK